MTGSSLGKATASTWGAAAQGDSLHSLHAGGVMQRIPRRATNATNAWRLALTIRDLSIKIIAINSMQELDPVKAEAGDKVRVKVGDYAGQRGVVEAVESEKLLLRLEESGSKVRVTPEQVTNYSLAARKAWVTEPDRAVGRPKGTRLTDRVSVTLRLDRALWEQFLGLEEAGVIDDRTGLINGWLREKLAELDREGRKS
ncbi:MAG TPA: hypothetical protein VKA46_34170 [Gemmataceae bacterium]|nr:hypothetical protein [Gemmataceae bacterium]